MADMRDIDDFLPQVSLYAPNCPDVVAYRYIREAAREFCIRTKAWRESDTLVVATPDDEAVCTISDAEIILIQRAELDGAPLTPQTVEWMDANRPGWETDVEPASPRFITQVRPSAVSIYPRATGTLTMRLVLKPSLTALTLPGFLLDQWGAEIGKGAAGQIMLLPTTDNGGGNPALGQALLAVFNAALGTEAIRVARGQQGARLRTKGNYF